METTTEVAERPQSQGERRSGRTTRMLQAAVEGARMGFDQYVVAANSASAQMMFDVLSGWNSDRDDRNSWSVWFGDARVQVIERWMAMIDWSIDPPAVRGRRDITVHVDHLVAEMRSRNAG